MTKYNVIYSTTEEVRTFFEEIHVFAPAKEQGPRALTLSPGPDHPWRLVIVSYLCETDYLLASSRWGPLVSLPLIRSALRVTSGLLSISSWVLPHDPGILRNSNLPHSHEALSF